ncbi:MAG: ATP-binding protein [Spirochaetes bacterium]|nr:ATP-binding protein [Spirochaetota bacterium]
MAQQEKTYILNESFPSDQNKRKEIIDSLCHKIVKSPVRMAITPEELYLSLDEAITNAMEHGNKWDVHKTINVTAYADKKEIHILITDQGKGFDTREIESQLDKRDILSSRGRGIFIINQFCQITWNKKGNQVDLHIKRRT